MGAWGIGPFDNDGAGDFMGGLRENPNWAAVKDLFARVLAAQGYLESPDGQEAIAAAAVVASVKSGNALSDFDLDVEVIKGLHELPPELITFALQALERVRGEDSELADLWEEAGQLGEWTSVLLKIESMLRA